MAKMRNRKTGGKMVFMDAEEAEGLFIDRGKGRSMSYSTGSVVTPCSARAASGFFDTMYV